MTTTTRYSFLRDYKLKKDLTTIIIGDLRNTELDTLCLFPMDSKLAGSNVTNDPLPKRWVPWDGLYVVSSLIQVFM